MVKTHFWWGCMGVRPQRAYPTTNCNNSKRSISTTMKSLRNITNALKKARVNQPKVTLVEAQAQAKRVKDAADKAGAKSGPPLFLSRERWEEVLKSCVNAEAEVEHLQEQLEDMDLRMADVDEQYRRQVQETLHLAAQLGVVKSANTQTLADRESRITKLSRDLETSEGNKRYACDHISEQNKLIRDAKEAMETLRTENEQLKAKQVNAEHLAKKVIQLQQEVVKSDSYYCPFQKTKDVTHIPCGKCVACKLDAAYGIIERSAENVKHLEIKLQHALEEVQFKTKVLEQTSENLSKVNKDKVSVEKIYSKSLNESNELAGALQREKVHLNEIIRQQRDALEVIARGALFKHADIAHNVLMAVMEYKKENNLL